MDAMQYRKEREGVDELKAADTALLTGMADYYLENLGYRHISRCVEEGVRKSLVRKIGESFLTGAGMALGSETGGQLIDWMLNGRLSEWGKIYNAHLDEGMSETEAFGEMVKAVGPELTVHTVAGGISGAGFAVIHMLAASKDNRLRKQETIEKTNQGGERNRNESGSKGGSDVVQSKFNKLLNSDYYKNNPGYDCSEIATDFYDAAGQQGKIYRIEGKDGVINGYEYGKVYDFEYHEVYSDGVYIYDPRYQNTPVLKDDYFRALKEINPDGFDVFTIQ